jgi:hypothetical protein
VSFSFFVDFMLALLLFSFKEQNKERVLRSLTRYVKQQDPDQNTFLTFSCFYGKVASHGMQRMRLKWDNSL